MRKWGNTGVIQPVGMWREGNTFLHGNSQNLFLIYKQGKFRMINTIPDAVKVGLLCTWSSFHFLCWLHNCLFWVELMPLEEIKVCRAIDRSKWKAAKILSRSFWKPGKCSHFLHYSSTNYCRFSAAFIQLCRFLRAAWNAFVLQSEMLEEGNRQMSEKVN